MFLSYFKKTFTKHHHRILSLGIILCASAVIISGCSIVDLPGTNERPRIFTLTPKNKFDLKLPYVKSQILVEEPYAAAALNTARIALRKNGLSFDYFARSIWVDRAPTMLQNLIVESFENTGKILGVARKSHELLANYILKIELREFQIEYPKDSNSEHAAKANVRFHVKLIDRKTRSIIAHENFSYLEPIQSNNMNDIVAAYDIATGKVIKKLVSWTLISVSNFEMENIPQ